MLYEEPFTHEKITGTEFCSKFGISYQTFIKRFEKYGNTMDVIYPVKDHLGNRYKNISEMCEKYNTTISAYKERIKRGHSVEESLCPDKYIRKKKNPSPSRVPESMRTDHNGRVFRTKNEMCNYYNVPMTFFDHRLERGYTLEEALTGKTSKQIIAPNGIQYSSMAKMCEAYGISYSAFEARRKKGMTIEEALTYVDERFQVKDHLGNVYESQREMTKHYGIKMCTFRARLAHGWSLKDTLTRPVGYAYASEKNANSNNDCPTIKKVQTRPANKKREEKMVLSSSQERYKILSIDRLVHYDSDNKWTAIITVNDTHTGKRGQATLGLFVINGSRLSRSDFVCAMGELGYKVEK